MDPSHRHSKYRRNLYSDYSHNYLRRYVSIEKEVKKKILFIIPTIF